MPESDHQPLYSGMDKIRSRRKTSAGKTSKQETPARTHKESGDFETLRREIPSNQQDECAGSEPGADARACNDGIAMRAHEMLTRLGAGVRVNECAAGAVEQGSSVKSGACTGISVEQNSEALSPACPSYTP